MSILGRLLKKFFTLDIPSASDIIKRWGIDYKPVKNTITIDLTQLNISFTKPPKVWIPSIPDTNSMDPSFDFGHNNILIAGADEENQKILIDFLQIGDIIVYRNQLYVIHRIVKIETDSKGRKFTLKGDNSMFNDPYPVRDKHIQWLCLGTIF